MYGRDYLCITAPCPGVQDLSSPGSGFARPIAPAGLSRIAKAPTGMGIPRDPGAGINFGGIAAGLEKLALSTAVDWALKNPDDKGAQEIIKHELGRAPAPDSPVDPPSVPTVGALPSSTIPPEEMAEIDAYIAEQEAKAERIEELKELIPVKHPDELLDLAVAIADSPPMREKKKQLAGRKLIPPPEVPVTETVAALPPPAELLEEYVETLPPEAPARRIPVAPVIPLPVAPRTPKRTEPPADPELTRVPTRALIETIDDMAPAPRPDEPDPYEAQPEEQPMADLSDIFGAIGDRIVGSLDFDPRTPGIFGGLGTSLPDIVASGWPVEVKPTPIPGTGGPVQDVVVAHQTGTTPQQVAAIKHMCKPRRRRRRMLTKSDVADISTMAALLGKNSESFKTWLAKATR